MRIVATFDPANPGSQFATSFNASFANGTGKMVVHNESNNNLQLSWGTYSAYCPAWMSVLFCVTAPSPNINWAIQSTLSSASSPISMVVVEAYEQNETVVGTYPSPLVRQANIGNTLTLSSAQIIVDTGRPVGQSTLFAQPLGDADPNGATNITNNGLATFGDTVESGLVTVNGPTSGTQSTLGPNSLHILGANGLDLINMTSDIVAANANGNGVAHMYQIFRAQEYKKTIIYCIGFLNSGANLDLNLPVPYLSPFTIRTTDVGLLNFMNGAAAQNVDVITAIAAGGGSFATQTGLSAYSVAGCKNPCSALRFVGGQATTRNGLIIMEGR